MLLDLDFGLGLDNIFILILPVVVHHINKGRGPLSVLEVDVVDVSVIHNHLVLG